MNWETKRSSVCSQWLFRVSNPARLVWGLWMLLILIRSFTRWTTDVYFASPSLECLLTLSSQAPCHVSELFEVKNVERPRRWFIRPDPTSAIRNSLTVRYELMAVMSIPCSEAWTMVQNLTCRRDIPRLSVLTQQFPCMQHLFKSGVCWSVENVSACREEGTNFIEKRTFLMARSCRLQHVRLALRRYAIRIPAVFIQAIRGFRWAFQFAVLWPRFSAPCSLALQSTFFPFRCCCCFLPEGYLSLNEEDLW